MKIKGLLYKYSGIQEFIAWATNPEFGNDIIYFDRDLNIRSSIDHFKFNSYRFFVQQLRKKKLARITKTNTSLGEHAIFEFEE